jgi:endonuclease/exonuclease/phosphatase family metal-dependent hydrolase
MTGLPVVQRNGLVIVIFVGIIGIYIGGRQISSVTHEEALKRLQYYQLKEKDGITVMSFNLRHSGIDVHNPELSWWNNRKAIAAETVSKYKPTIVGVQESAILQVETLVQLISHTSSCSYGYYGEKDGIDMPNAIIYDRNRAQLIKGGRFWLSETRLSKSVSWNSAHPRCLTWAHFRLKDIPSAEFIFLNTHLDVASELARYESARLIMSQLQDFVQMKIPIFLTADFNSAPGQRPYRVFMNHETTPFLDSWNTVENRNKEPLPSVVSTYHHFWGERITNNIVASCAFLLGLTYHGGCIPNQWGRYHIDWILYQSSAKGTYEVEPQVVLVATDHRDQHYPSDHFPVVAFFSFTRR